MLRQKSNQILPQKLLKEGTTHFYCLFDESHFSVRQWNQKNLIDCAPFGNLDIGISTLASASSSDWKPPILSDNVLQRVTVKNTWTKTSVLESVFDEIAGINSRLASLMEKSSPKAFTFEYIRTFSASTGRCYISSIFS